MRYIITFDSHVDAIQTKKIFKKNKLKLALKPLPISLSSDCGICAITKENFDTFNNILDKYNSIYCQGNNEFKIISTYKKI